MQRRNFMKNAGLAGASIFAAGLPGSAGAEDAKTALPDKPFNLNYAVHDGMFRNNGGKDLLDQIRYARERGFRSFEDNEMRLRTPERQEQIGSTLSKLGMDMGVFVGHSLDWKEPTLSKGDKTINERFLSEMREAVNISKRCGSKYVVVVPGVISHNIDIAYQKSTVLDTLRKAVDICTPHQLTILLEPLNFRDHPSQLLPDVPNLYQMIKAVNSEHCKMLFDVYHVQIHTGNIIPNIDLAWDEIVYFQVADNPGRKEPLTGEINYKNVFRHIHGKGFRGIVGMEHGNSAEGAAGELKVLEAYRQCDNFLAGK